MSHSIHKDENLQGRKKNNFHNIFCDKVLCAKKQNNKQNKKQNKKKTTLTTIMSMSSTLHLFNLLTDPEIQHGI